MRGAMGDHVETIQQTLKASGLYDGMIDGYYGPMTTSAVKDWQRALRLVPTGEWDGFTSTVSAEFLQFLRGDGTFPVAAPQQKARPLRSQEGNS
jgi:peptidoglycan hydrolase-like protein with peptidoglycan-binding domain